MKGTRLLAAAVTAAFAVSSAGCSIYMPEKGSEQSSSEETAVSTVSTDSPANEQIKADSDLTPIYDDTAVVSAFKLGDDSGLSEFDREIYREALNWIGEFFSDDMSTDEIVLAAHDYITTHCAYDDNELALFSERSENSENPYGALINNKAICMGYTTTFQLFMDMLGVESIIIRGESDGEEHAWNMVHIGEKWYHVDCTWDDYLPDYEGRPAAHAFYMLTDAAVQIDHVWDSEATPTADSEDMNYYMSNGLIAENTEQMMEIIEAAAKKGLTEAEFALPKDYDTESMYFLKFEGGAVYSYWPIEFDDYKVVLAHIRSYE